jgi:hypothetical protein
VTQALSVIHVLIPSKATEYRLPQQTDQRMTAVLARACISERRPRYRAQPKRIIEFAIRQLLMPISESVRALRKSERHPVDAG